MLCVIGEKQSRTFRVLWMLEELGLEYDHVAAGPHSPEVTRHNPAGKIPVLLDGGTAITDSTAILQYLADAHGRFTYPSGTIERARQDSFTALLLDEFDTCLWAAAKHSFVLPPEHRIREIKRSLRWEFSRSTARLAARMEDQGYLMGPELTVPDIILAHCLIWAKIANFAHSQPALDAFLERMCMRPAYTAINRSQR